MPRPKKPQPPPEVVSSGEDDLEKHTRLTWPRGSGKIQTYDVQEYRASVLLHIADLLTDGPRAQALKLWTLLEGTRKDAALAKEMSAWEGNYFCERTYRTHAKHIREQWKGYPPEYRSRLRPKIPP
jgi:hypothetical protein